MKKAIAIILIMLMALTCSLAFVGCKKDNTEKVNYSETFTGAVSETTYDSVEDTVKGFLAEEISGQAYTAEYVGYTKTQDLSQEEIDTLAIDEEYKDGIVSIEKGEVEYIEATSGYGWRVTEENSTDDVKVRVIYIITYTDMFRFFIPANSQGEALSSSYFGSIFDGKNYVNCTLEAELVIKEEGITMKSTANCKITENGICESDKTEVSGPISYSTPTVDTYIVPFGNKLYQVGKDDFDSALKVQVEIWHTTSEFMQYWFKNRFADLDHTYFEKTATGYKLRADKYNEYMKKVLYHYDLDDFDLEYTINIADGKIADLSLKVSYKGYGSSMKCKFSNFGTTSVTIPQEVMRVAQEYIGIR